MLEWLNLSAALTLGMAVMNILPVAGLGPQEDGWIYGSVSMLDMAATLLAWKAVSDTGPKEA
ncbi:hypothetical protein ACFP81_05855 [Deinococcus lacus]|uniref:Peptidase M50 domain-containing protein n=1 Tax=Deinococcus lacus TaxID=392561 RepID=A0ABW1YBA2_9DEIO